MSSLWQILKTQQQSAPTPFNAHFADPSLQLATLLSDDRIVTAFKNHNHLLFKYISEHPEIYAELVQYITVEPTEEDTADRKHRYPFVAGEILGIENSMVYEVFFGVEDDSGEEEGEGKGEGKQDYRLLDKVLSYPKTNPLNPLLMGYCEKVFLNLFHGQRDKLLAHWFTHYASLYPALLSNTSISNILRQIITLPTTQSPQSPAPPFLPQRLSLLSTILHSYPLSSQQHKANTIDIFKEIFGKYLMISGGREMLEMILGSSEVYLKGEVVGEHTLSFVRDLLVKVGRRVGEEEEGNVIVLPEEFLVNLNRCVLGVIGKEGGEGEGEGRSFLNQSRVKVTLSGKQRMFLLETLRYLLPLNPLPLTHLLLSSHLLPYLFSLISTYKFNNILHCAIQNILLTLLRHPSSLQPDLVVKYNLVESLCGLLEDEGNSLAFGQLCSVFLELMGSEEEVVKGKMGEGRVMAVYEEVVLPRKEKNQFRWAGGLTSYKTKPISVGGGEGEGEVDCDGNKTGELGGGKGKVKEGKKEFEFDFSQAKVKEPSKFDPFTAFPSSTSSSIPNSESKAEQTNKTEGASKPTSDDFNFFF